MLRTAVVGAGPAGLVFTLVAKILMRDAIAIRLFDKREAYVRTHRLRIDPAPWREIRATLGDPHFDRLIAFLEENDLSPEVNLLEAKLTELLAELGVEKTVREISSLDELDEDADTIVGADSVHSTIRELVRGDVTPTKRTHELVARLRVSGRDLPPRLGVLDQFRLSKLLGSLVDYRVNKNGFAEVDLFVTEAEHTALRALGATPKEPVAITARSLSKVRAPFVRAVVAHLEGEGRTIVVQSTFTLEHTVMPNVTFTYGERRVFLVGDAGVSLPFFRGMACLASCAHALARAHATGAWDAYEADVRAIVEREVAVVRSRARIIRLLRELVRLSSLLPFPIQSWWLSAAEDPEPDRLSKGVTFNAAVAASATLFSLLGIVTPWPWLALLAFPIEVLGGVAYRWTLDLEPGPHRFLRAIWQAQIVVVAIAGGLAIALLDTTWLAAAFWWLLGIPFAVGIYVFERLVARPLRVT